jgi:hypothetical protein
VETNLQDGLEINVFGIFTAKASGHEAVWTLAIVIALVLSYRLIDGYLKRRSDVIATALKAKNPRPASPHQKDIPAP